MPRKGRAAPRSPLIDMGETPGMQPEVSEGASKLDDSIDEWVSHQLEASPEWDSEKWDRVGRILDVEFTPPGG